MKVHTGLGCPDITPGDELTENVHETKEATCSWCRREADPDRYGVGDPDPTLFVGYPNCGANGPGTEWICTRTRNHDGQHVAGDGDTVLQVWRS